MVHFITSHEMKRLISILLTLSFLTACSSSPTIKPTFTKGEEVSVIESAYVAIDKDTYSKLMDIVKAKNNDGIITMIGSGKAALLMEGYEVTIMNNDEGNHLIKIMLSDGTEVIANEKDFTGK